MLHLLVMAVFVAFSLLLIKIAFDWVERRRGYGEKAQIRKRRARGTRVMRYFRRDKRLNQVAILSPRSFLLPLTSGT